jgi:AcrR family transcriptional regulator
MTIKQESILTQAINLFELHGYHAISTKKIANQANVSEGLIFKHFKDKEGLLAAVLIQLYKIIKSSLQPILMSEFPKEVIKETVHLPYNLEENETKYWSLYLKLDYQNVMRSEVILKSLNTKLVEVFNDLNYKHPQLEADLLIMIIKGSILNHKYQKADFERFLLNKYHL